MERDKLRSLLRKMENEAQLALSEDGSFLEALQVLKFEIDSDRHVRVAMRAFRDRGLRVFASLKPRIHIQVHAGENVLTPYRDLPETRHPDSGFASDAASISSEPLMREMLDAASAVLATSPLCHSLEKIISEAVQANRTFERMARSIESVGYQLRICLDLSPYAHVRAQDQDRKATSDRHTRKSDVSQPLLPGAVESAHFPLSDPDAEFLKMLRISPE